MLCCSMCGSFELLLVLPIQTRGLYEAVCHHIPAGEPPSKHTDSKGRTAAAPQVGYECSYVLLAMLFFMRCAVAMQSVCLESPK